MMDVNSIIRKLQLKDQNPILIINSPEEYNRVIQSVQSEIHHQPQQEYSFIQIFVNSITQADELIPESAFRLEGDGMLWICYPKKSSKKYNSDISRDQGWDTVAKLDLEPVTMISINEDWSALRFRKVEYIKKLTRKWALSEKGKERISGKVKK
jgi:hypothetical protein